MLNDNLREVYKIQKSQPQKYQWPPDQPKVIVNIALIHHEGEQTQQELIDMSMHNVSVIEKLSYHLRATKRISDLFRSSHNRILIEGAPGIGKTVLAKEIVYSWVNGEILTDMKLFLLFVRDPHLHCVKSIDELVCYLGKSYLNDTEIKVAADELKKSKGSNTAFVIDGYDECPCGSAVKEFIDKLYQQELLTKCLVVITSRPTASLLLRQSIGQRIEILGLAKLEQNLYISKSLEGSTKKVDELQEYLKQHPKINSLIHVPLHLAVLVYLFKQDSLPETLTKMNDLFIVHTIYQQLNKRMRPSCTNVQTIANFPQYIRSVINKLSKLAFKGLQANRLVFTKTEVKEVCPEVAIDNIPGAINGFGLLQAVQHYSKEGAGETVTLNFVHFTMQEYLAALYVSSLSREQQSSLMKKTFWDGQFNLMWIMYVGIVGPESIELINSLHLIHPYTETESQQHNLFAMKYLFLFQCYLELENTDLIPKVITSIFSDGNIDLHGQTLLPHNVMSLTVFMSKFITRWKSLNLRRCSINSNSLNILTQFFKNFKEQIITFKYVNLSNNNLYSLWAIDTEITQDDIGNGLLLSVESLDLSYNQFSGSGTDKLFFALRCNSKLKALDISYNTISNNGVMVISECLKINRALCNLNISSNKITNKGANNIAEALEVNMTLQELNISNNWISKKGVMRVLKACAKNRTLCKVECTHNNLSRFGVTDIITYIKEENAVQIFNASWNSFGTKSNQLAIKTTFHVLDVQQKLQSNNETDHVELWFIDEITELKYRTKFLHCCFEEYLDVQSVDLSAMGISNFELATISDFLKYNSKLLELRLSNNKISGKGVLQILKIIETITTLQNIDLSQNTISDDGILGITSCLKCNDTLTKLNLSSNEITNTGAKEFVKILQVNTTLKELNISKNWISKEGIMGIVEACTKNSTLHKLVCTHNDLSQSELATVSKYITEKNVVQIFEASWNSISSIDNQLAIKTVFQSLNVHQNLHLGNYNAQQELWFSEEIMEVNYRSKFLHTSFVELLNALTVSLQDVEMTDFQFQILSDCLKNNDRVINLNLSNTVRLNSSIFYGCGSDHYLLNLSSTLSAFLKINDTLCVLNLSSNHITSEGAEMLMNAVAFNSRLQNLDISCNQISDRGALAVVYCLEVNRTLCKLDISKNIITDEGGKNIAIAITVNKTLKELNISKNAITDEGAKSFANAIRVNKTLQILNISKTGINKNGVMGIVNACTTNRTLYKLVCTHNNLSKSGLAAINEYIRKENAIQIFDASWSNIDFKNGHGTIMTTFQLLDLQQKLLIDTDCHEEISELTWEDKKRFSHCCIEEYLNVQSVSLQNNGMGYFGIEIEIISDCLKFNSTLHTLNLSSNKITDEGAKSLAEAIQVNTTIQKLNISKNWVSKEGVMRIVEACTENRTLHKLVCTHNNLSKSELVTINEYIRKENAVQIFDASWNTIEYIRKENKIDSVDAIFENFDTKDGQLFIKTIFQLLDNHKTTSQSSNIQQKVQSVDDITDAKVELWFLDEITEPQYRREFLQCEHLNVVGVDLSDMTQMGIMSDCLKGNEKIIEVNLSTSQLSNFGIAVFVFTVKDSTTLRSLDVSNNTISDDGVLFISAFLKINTLCKMNLSNNEIRDEETKLFSEALQVNTMLQVLNMSKNKITDEGANELSKAIQVNKTLQELNLSKNWISKEGVIRIVEACTKNRALHKLVCTHNNLSKSGLAAINEYIRKENAVQIFDASWNTIGAKGDELAIKTIFQLLDISKATFRLSDVQKKLQSGSETREELWCANNINDLKYRREFLQCCIEESEHMNVKYVNLSDMDQTDIISDCLKRNKKVTEVNLCSCKVTDEGVKSFVQAIEVSTTLQNLDISTNAISSDGALSISDFLKISNTLCMLNLSGNKIRDDGTRKLLEVIRRNTTLQDLNVSRNKITDEGASEISKAIQVNKTLQKLNISKNWISKIGVMRIVEACTENRTLHKLVCTHNNLSKSGLAAINEYIKKENALQIFDASWNTIGNKYGQPAIITTFQLLDISKTTFQLLGLQQKLQSGSDTHEDLWFADEINELNYRRKFLLCCIEECQYLNLENADLSDMAEIGVIIDCLMLNKKITEVNLCSCQITNEGIEVLVQAVEVSATLQKLDISSNAISDNGVLSVTKFLMRNHTLCKLNLSGNKIQDEGIKILAKAIQVNTILQGLNMSRNKVTDEGANELLKAIQVNKTLQELDISKNWISKEGVMRIVEACTKNRTLHILVCTHNNLSKSGLAAINEYIRKENAVQIFDASWNTIGRKDGQLAIITTFQLLNISETIFQLPGMEHKLQSGNDNTFSMEESWFPDEINELKYQREFLQCCVEEIQQLCMQDVNLSDMNQIGIISDCLKLNNKITDVNLCSCRVTNKGIKVLVQAVEVSTTLRNFDVSTNAISSDGALSISDFLNSNNTLCVLNLSGNKIRDEGTKKLLEAIQVNTTLQDLNISGNKITNKGANELAKAIQLNRTLQKLNISKNWISKEGVMRIVEACTGNKTLHKLVCTHNNLSKSELAAINDYLKKENAVQIFDTSWNGIVASGRYGSLIIATFQSLKWSFDGWEFTLFGKQMCIVNDGVWNDKIEYDFTHDPLKEMNFPTHSIPSNLLADIMQQVMKIDTLQKLTIPLNEISNDEAIAFNECLKTNTTLIELDLSRNHAIYKGGSAIAEALKVNDTLQKLRISHNGMSDDGAIAFSECLKTNITLIELDLSGNHITYKGGSAIAEALEVNDTLQKLKISHNRIADDGAIAFSECLKTNTTLIELDLSENNINSEILQSIAQAIDVNNKHKAQSSSYNM